MHANAAPPSGEPTGIPGFAAPEFHPCDLAQYRYIVAQLPRPSETQVNNFVEFVCEAHSWYKHLPLLPPGEPFRFFIDPFSGYDRAVGSHRRIHHRERTKDTPRFHYTWMTTADYRARFGHLTYDARAGMSFLVVSAGDTREYAQRPVFFTEDQGYWIPPEVAEAGCVNLTAIVHPDTAEVWVWQTFLPPPEARCWPEETGGMQTLRRILEVCNGPEFVAKRERKHKRFDEITDGQRVRLSEPEERELSQELVQLARSLNRDEDLVRLLEPEKRRLQEEMTKVIRRMLDMLFV